MAISSNQLREKQRLPSLLEGSTVAEYDRLHTPKSLLRIFVLSEVCFGIILVLETHLQKRSDADNPTLFGWLSR